MNVPGYLRASAIVGVLALATACANDAGSGAEVPAIPSTNPTSSVAMLDDGVTVLSLNFDEVDEGLLDPGQVFSDVSGNSNDAIYAVPEEGGRVPPPRIFAHETGKAVEFRKPCDSGPDCIRGIIEVPSVAELNPVVSDFAFGLDLRVVAEDIRSGGNLVQKGFSTGPGGQWKLQVDEKSGFPSCVLVDSLDNEFLQVEGDVSVADGQWHSIVCERLTTELAMWVDGAEAGRVRSREVFLIDNDWPIRIAGKHVKENGDFYFGGLDNVFLTISS